MAACDLTKRMVRKRLPDGKATEEAGQEILVTALPVIGRSVSCSWEAQGGGGGGVL